MNVLILLFMSFWFVSMINCHEEESINQNQATIRLQVESHGSSIQLLGDSQFSTGYLYTITTCAKAHDIIQIYAIQSCIPTSSTSSIINELSLSSQSNREYYTLNQYNYPNVNDCSGQRVQLASNTSRAWCVYGTSYSTYVSGSSLSTRPIPTAGIALVLCSGSNVIKATYTPLGKCVYNSLLSKYYIVRLNSEGALVYYSSSSSSCINPVYLGILPSTGCNNPNSFSYYGYQYMSPELYPTLYDPVYDPSLAGYAYIVRNCGTDLEIVVSQAVNVCFRGPVTGSIYFRMGLHQGDMIWVQTNVYLSTDCTGAVNSTGLSSFLNGGENANYTTTCVTGRTYTTYIRGALSNILVRKNGFAISRHALPTCEDYISGSYFSFYQCSWVLELSAYAYAYPQGNSVVYVSASNAACTQSRQTHALAMGICVSAGSRYANEESYGGFNKIYASTAVSFNRPGYIFSITNCGTNSAVIRSQSVNLCWTNNTHNSYALRPIQISDTTFQLIGYRYDSIDCSGAVREYFYQAPSLHYDDSVYPTRDLIYSTTCQRDTTQYSYVSTSIPSNIVPRNGIMIKFSNESDCSSSSSAEMIYYPTNQCLQGNEVSLRGSATTSIKYVTSGTSTIVKYYYDSFNCSQQSLVSDLTVRFATDSCLVSNSTFQDYRYYSHAIVSRDSSNVNYNNTGYIYRIENCGTSSLVITSQSVNVCWRITNSTGNVVASYITNVTSASTGTGVMALTRVYTTPDCSGVIQGYSPAVILQANRTANNIFSVPTLSKTINSILSASATRSSALYNIYSTTCISGKTQYRYLPGGMSADELNGDLNGVSLFYYANYNCSGEASELMSFYPLNQCIRHNNTLSSVTVFKYDSESAMVKLYSYVGGDIGSCSAVSSSLVLLESHSSNVCSVVGEIGGYGMQQMGSMKFTLINIDSSRPSQQPTLPPSHMPSSKPSTTPTQRVTVSPTGRPTLLPTTPVTNSFSLTHTLLGCSFTDYSSNRESYESIFKQSLVAASIVTSVDNVKSIIVQEYTASVSQRRQLTVQSGLNIEYTIESIRSLDSFTSAVVSVFNNGELARQINLFATQNSISGLSNVTIDSQSLQIADSDSGVSSSASSSAAPLMMPIIGAVVGGVVLIAIVGTIIYLRGKRATSVGVVRINPHEMEVA